MLSNFQLEDHALLQSFLIGQPEFREMMQGPQMQQLRQRVIASYHLGPLDGEETRAYIEHRLHHVGWQDNPHIAPGVFHKVYAATGGIPRRINTLFDRILLAGFLAESATISEADVDAVLDELKEEQAPAADAPVWSTRAVPRPINGSASHAERLNGASKGLPAIGAGSDLAEQLSAIVANFDNSRFENRLANVENTLAAALSLLDQLVAKTKRHDPPGGK
jgi:hypothetical protein